MSTFVWSLPSPGESPPPSVSIETSALEALLFGNFDQELDPATGDYVDTSDGAWSETASSRTAVMLQLEIRYSEWWIDPEAGSRIPAMLEADEPAEPEEILDEAKRALQMLVVDGIIADLSVELGTVDRGGGFMELLISYTDMSSGHVVDLSYQPLAA